MPSGANCSSLRECPVAFRFERLANENQHGVLVVGSVCSLYFRTRNSFCYEHSDVVHAGIRPHCGGLLMADFRRTSDASRRRSRVSENVDHPPEWVADEEPTDSPRFVGRAVLDREAGGFHALECGIQVIYFNR